MAGHDVAEALAAAALLAGFMLLVRRSGLLGSSPPAAVFRLLAAAPEILLAAAWLVRPRLVLADRLTGLGAAIVVGWLLGWSGAIPLGGHLEPGRDQAAGLVLQVALLLWLTLATRRPALAPPAGDRVRLCREEPTVGAAAPLVGVPGWLARSR